MKNTPEIIGVKYTIWTEDNQQLEFQGNNITLEYLKLHPYLKIKKMAVDELVYYPKEK